MGYVRRLAMAAVACGLLVAMPGSATVFVLAEPEDLLSSSDAVVLGQVEAIESVQTDHGVHTNVTLIVERSLKSDTEERLTLVETGGAVETEQRWVQGAATYFLGERVLVFVRRRGDGTLRTTFLSMGKFRVVRSSDGNDFAVRSLQESTILHPRTKRRTAGMTTTFRLPELWQRLQRHVPRSHARRWLDSRPADGTHHRPRFSFGGPPAARWFLPAADTPVNYQIDAAGDLALGSFPSVTAAREALAAWSESACSNLTLADTVGATPAPFAACDGRTQVLFNDPFGEIEDPIDCLGILAIGGVCVDPGGTRPFAGGHYYPLMEGDVIVNNGFQDCPFWTAKNLAEVLTHEVGHTFGLGHSSDDPDEEDPLLRDATMYYQVHFDERGAGLRDDDQAAICALYPSGDTARFEVERLALIYDSRQRAGRDRLVLDGALQIFQPKTAVGIGALTLTVHVSGEVLLRAAVAPELWRQNSSETRLRFRQRDEDSALSVSLRDHGRGRYDVQVRASGLELKRARFEGVTLSISLGDASATKAIPLSSRARTRRFP